MKKISFALAVMVFILFPLIAPAVPNETGGERAFELQVAPHRSSSTAQTSGTSDSGAVLAWLGDEPKKNAFFIFVGGFIPAVIGLVGVVLNNKNALKRQEQANTHQIKMLQLEEKKKIATDILLAANPININNIVGLDVENIVSLHHVALLVCPDEYCCYTNGLVGLAIQNNAFSPEFLGQFDKDRRKVIVESYSNFYNICVYVSRLMLANEKIIPTHDWNIDDFEGSVPLDYRELLP